MEKYDTDTYGERIAADYDDVFASLETPENQIGLLRELAGVGTAVELGVGTGRVAIPLARGPARGAPGQYAHHSNRRYRLSG